MASKKYKPMPDLSQQDCFMNKKYSNIDFRKEEEFQLRIFYDCVFMNCNFEYVGFDYCIFIKCIFEDCNLRYTRWLDCRIDNTKFNLCSLRGAAFRNFHFYESAFYGNILCDASFIFGYFIASKISSVSYKRKCPEDSELSLVTKPYKGAIFNNVEFNGSNFNHIDFNKFDMRRCSFNEDTFDICKNIPYIPMTCPEEGSFIAYKKVLTNIYGSLKNSTAIAVLEIPADAKRSSGAGTRKCRCNKAKVLRFEDMDGNVLNEFTKGYSYYDGGFIYHVGEYAAEEDFDDDRWEQCSTGIHFFMNRQEAINYIFN